MKQEIFRDKAIIGLLHLGAMPGDPFFNGSMDEVVSQAKDDLIALQDGGVDAVLLTNEFSMPYTRRTSAAVVGAMGRAVGELRSFIRVPFGVETIYDPDTCVELCAATGAHFTRCLMHSAWVSDAGVQSFDLSATLRLRKALSRSDLALFYFVNAEGSTPLDSRGMQEKVSSLLFTARPEYLVVGGEAAGSAPTAELLRTVKSAAGSVPVFCGTGCREDNLEQILSVADGAFIGSALKRGGKLEAPVDGERVGRLMEKVRRLREGRPI